MEPFSNACRLCLWKGDKMIDVFRSNQKFSILDKIHKCIPIKFQKSDVTHVICHNCYYKLEIFAEFLTVCSRSDIILKRYIETQILNSNEESTDYPELTVVSVTDSSEDGATDEETGIGKNRIGSKTSTAMKNDISHLTESNEVSAALKNKVNAVSVGQVSEKADLSNEQPKQLQRPAKPKSATLVPDQTVSKVQVSELAKQVSKPQQKVKKQVNEVQVSGQDKQTVVQDKPPTAPVKQVAIVEKPDSVQDKQVTLQRKPAAVQDKQVTPDKQVTVQSKQVASDKQVTVQSKQVASDKQVTVQSKQVPPDKQISVQSKQVTSDKQVTVQSKQVTSDKQVTVQSKQVTSDKQVTVQSKQVTPDKQVTVQSKQVPSDKKLTVPSKQVTAPDKPVTAQEKQISLQKKPSPAQEKLDSAQIKQESTTDKMEAVQDKLVASQKKLPVQVAAQNKQTSPPEKPLTVQIKQFSLTEKPIIGQDKQVTPQKKQVVAQEKQITTEKQASLQDKQITADKQAAVQPKQVIPQKKQVAIQVSQDSEGIVKEKSAPEKILRSQWKEVHLAEELRNLLEQEKAVAAFLNNKPKASPPVARHSPRLYNEYTRQQTMVNGIERSPPSLDTSEKKKFQIRFKFQLPGTLRKTKENHLGGPATSLRKEGKVRKKIDKLFSQNSLPEGKELPLGNVVERVTVDQSHSSSSMRENLSSRFPLVKLNRLKSCSVCGVLFSSEEDLSVHLATTCASRKRRRSPKRDRSQRKRTRSSWEDLRLVSLSPEKPQTVSVLESLGLVKKVD